jgi:hypothetical protein
MSISLTQRYILKTIPIVNYSFQHFQMILHVSSCIANMIVKLLILRITISLFPPHVTNLK